MNKFNSTLVYASFVAVLTFVNSIAAQVPEWIWHDNQGVAPAETEIRFFRKTFTVDGAGTRAVLTATGDDQATVFLNGKQVASSRSWNRPATVNVSQDIVPGENVIAVRGQNAAGDAAIIVKLQLTSPNNQKRLVVSDTTWLSSAEGGDGWQRSGFAAAGWTKPVSRGKLGVQPWGDVMAAPAATSAESLKVLPGFKVELVRSSEPGEGSWVSMTVDPKGRLIISPQDGNANLLRITLSSDGKIEKLETINLPVGGAMGLLYAFDSLYVNGKGRDGLALYRLRDTDGDDQFDNLETIRKWSGDGGEHGPHGVVLGPDKKLYVVCGNFVNVPPDISPNSPHRNYADDLLLPRAEDGNGFGAGKKPPGGYVARMDPDGKNCELFAAGFRNTYDIAFDPNGELFGFDSDMEWDWGTPWYRPTRINHIVSGGDYGFREGSAKWPNWYADSLPTTLDIGIGSPTGVKFGSSAHFPDDYRAALYVMDWSYGRILAVHLKEKGATYSGIFENFVAPNSLQQAGPKATLNVTDLEFGKDGAMYFLTGGRGTQSGLYRVTYTKSIPASGNEKFASAGATEARKLRHQLERFHGKQDPAALDFAWPHLNSPDRWIRYAARIAIESQPVEQWQQRALEEKGVDASLTALLGLARMGPREIKGELVKGLGRFWPDGLNEEQKLVALRACSVALVRMGKPAGEMAEGVSNAVDPLYPSSSERLNRELCQLLIYLEAPGMVRKTLGLLAAAKTQEEQLVYIFHLRTLKTGWTMEDRQTYFSWFHRNRALTQHPAETLKWFRDVGRDYSDGASFPKFIANVRKDAVATLTDAERAELAPVIAGQAIAPKPPTVPRTFVKEWKMEDLLPALEQVSHGRSFQRGQMAYNDAQCIACHRFGNEGGATGPDLTAVSSRFTRRDILESILEPSKVLSEQYQNITVTKKNGDDITGRLVEETDQKLVLATNPLTNDKVEVNKRDVQKREASKVSPMPEGLVNILTKEEILDLLAYLESGGKPGAAAFKAGN